MGSRLNSNTVSVKFSVIRNLACATVFNILNPQIFVTYLTNFHLLCPFPLHHHAIKHQVFNCLKNREKGLLLLTHILIGT